MKRNARSAWAAWVLAAAVLTPPLARADEGTNPPHKKVVRALDKAAEHERDAAREEKSAAKAEERAADAEKNRKGTGGSGLAAKEAEAARKEAKATEDDVKALTDEVSSLHQEISQLRDQLSRRSELACETGTEGMSVRREQTPAIVAESGGTGHVWGKVEAAENDRLYIRGPKQNLFPVYVNEDTDARKEKHDVSVGEVKVGDTVDVSVESRKGDLIARDVEIVSDKEKDDREKAEEHRELERTRAGQEQKPPAFDAHQD